MKPTMCFYGISCVFSQSKQNQSRVTPEAPKGKRHALKKHSSFCAWSSCVILLVENVLILY